ncbi:MAG: DUF4127 family protein [Armatimonadota bacterium]
MTLRHRPHRILYVPADDRPCSVEWPRLLCRLVDWDLAEPPMELLGWFAQAGHPEDIATWALEAARDPLDGVVLSLDMLAYGGLHASRTSGIRTALAQRRLDILARLREALGDIPIYGFASIMGLTAITRSDESARYVDLLREYSIRLDASALREQEAAENPSEDEDTGIPWAVLGEYLAIRRRNRELNQRCLAEVAAGSLSYLVLAQDSSAAEGIHRYEQAELARKAEELGLSDRVALASGGAEMGMLLITRLIHQHMEKVPLVRLVYSYPTGADLIPEDEDRPIKQLVADVVEILGGQITIGNEGDLTTIVNCSPPEDTASDSDSVAQRARVMSELLARGEERAAGRGLAVIDLTVRQGVDEALMQALFTRDGDLPHLLAFSAWDRASASLGTGLAHAALRLISLQDKGAFDLAQLVADMSPMRYLALLDALIGSEKAHVTLIFSRLVEDWLYQSRVRPMVENHLVWLIRRSVVDMRQIHEHAEQMVRDLLTASAADLWIERFLGRTSVNIGTEPHRSALVLAELEETRLRLPWRRLAEVAVGVDFGVELAAG